MNLPSTICSPDDLHNMWKGIDGGFGYSVPQLFAVLIDTDGTPSKVLINIKDDGPLPCPIPELADHLVATGAMTKKTALAGGFLMPRVFLLPDWR